MFPVWENRHYLCTFSFFSLFQCRSSYVDVIEQAVVAGDTVLIENLEESIDPVIDPLLGRHTIKKGRYGHTREHVYRTHTQNIRAFVPLSFIHSRLVLYTSSLCSLTVV